MEPVDVNGINLVAAERFHLLYTDVYGIATVSLRLTNTYGPHLLMKHDRQGFITTFIRRALDGEEIRVFGDGSQLRDFTYVDDAVEAFLAAAVADEADGRALNVGGIEPVSLLEVAELCQEIAGEGGGVTTVPWPEERRRIDIGSVYLDRSQIREVCGWEPKVSLADGLRRTIDFYPPPPRALLELSARWRAASSAPTSTSSTSTRGSRCSSPSVTTCRTSICAWSASTTSVSASSATSATRGSSPCTRPSSSAPTPTCSRPASSAPRSSTCGPRRRACCVTSATATDSTSSPTSTPTPAFTQIPRRHSTRSATAPC